MKKSCCTLGPSDNSFVFLRTFSCFTDAETRWYHIVKYQVLWKWLQGYLSLHRGSTIWCSLFTGSLCRHVITHFYEIHWISSKWNNDDKFWKCSRLATYNNKKHAHSYCRLSTFLPAPLDYTMWYKILKNTDPLHSRDNDHKFLAKPRSYQYRPTLITLALLVTTIIALYCHHIPVSMRQPFQGHPSTEDVVNNAGKKEVLKF